MVEGVSVCNGQDNWFPRSSRYFVKRHRRTPRKSHRYQRNKKLTLRSWRVWKKERMKQKRIRRGRRRNKKMIYCNVSRTMIRYNYVLYNYVVYEIIRLKKKKKRWSRIISYHIRWYDIIVFYIIISYKRSFVIYHISCIHSFFSSTFSIPSVFFRYLFCSSFTLFFLPQPPSYELCQIQKYFGDIFVGEFQNRDD